MPAGTANDLNAVLPRPLEWLATGRELLASLRRLPGALRPTFHLAGVHELDPDFVRDHRIEGFIWDVDGTLMGHYRTAVAERLQPAFQRLQEMPGLRHVILSNCGEARYLQLAELFPTLPVLRAYRTPDAILFRRRIGDRDEWLTADGSPARPAVGARQVKKPALALMEFAVRELQPRRREAIVMVGDQYVTDIAGANAAGVRSIKVPTLEPASFPAALRRLQVLDRALFRLLHPGRGG